MKKALVSAYNKNEKLLEFVSFLIKKNYNIISTNGTYKYLSENGLHVTEISSITSFPDILNGRIKTIHPYIYGGILVNRSNKKQMESIKNYNIELIDIVLIDFYPFIDKIKNKSIDIKSMIEFIDIGGPSLLRSAAKNFLYVTPIIDSNDFKLIKKEIEKNKTTSIELRKKLAGKVFNFTSNYDAVISNYLLEEEKFPTYINFFYKKKMNLIYGENPHQKAAFYINNLKKGAMCNIKHINGKTLSFNNIKDMDIAWKIISQFSLDNPTCCTVKHSTPCGVASGKNIIEAFKKTYYSDQVSSFGGVMAFNTKVTEKLAKEINRIFLEVIIAPDYDTNAINILKMKKKIRIIIINNSISDITECVQVDGGVLIQETDSYLKKEDDSYKIVTEKKFSDNEIKSLFFAQKVVKYVKSNAIVIAKGTQTLGISGGQTNRIWAARQAINRALKNNKKGLVLVSDAFFPFRDVVDEAAKSECISAILQPGGSIRDDESIKACNNYGIAMAFTGKRYFKH